MSVLAKCPCGFVPEKLIVSEGSNYRWRYVSAHCNNENCPDWMIEVRVDIRLHGVEVYDHCVFEWNNAMRGTT